MLKPLTDWRPTISLVPFSGVQFVDYAFDVEAVGRFSRSFVERTEARRDEEDLKALIPLTGEDEEDARRLGQRQADDEEFAINKERALEPFLDKWVPVPFLRILPGRGGFGEELYDRGPTNWARVRVIPLATPDGGNTHRVVLAFDTELAARVENRPYLVPTPADAEDEVSFRFVATPEDMQWFLSAPAGEERGYDPQKWVDDWLTELFLEFRNAQRPGRPTRLEELPRRLEHWARYLTFLALLDHAIEPRPIKLLDSLSDPLCAGQGRPRAGHRQQPDLRHAGREPCRPDAGRPQQQLRARAARPRPPGAHLPRAVREPHRVLAGELRQGARGAPRRARPQLRLAEPRAGRARGAAHRRRHAGHRDHHGHVEPQALSLGRPDGQPGLALPGARLSLARPGAAGADGGAPLRQRPGRCDQPGRGRGAAGPAPARRREQGRHDALALLAQLALQLHARRDRLSGAGADQRCGGAARAARVGRAASPAQRDPDPAAGHAPAGAADHAQPGRGRHPPDLGPARPPGRHRRRAPPGGDQLGRGELHAVRLAVHRDHPEVRRPAPGLRRDHGQAAAVRRSAGRRAGRGRAGPSRAFGSRASISAAARRT